MVEQTVARAAGMTRRGWILFAAMGVIWGIPYLFIKIAVEEISPATVVGLRTVLGALVLVPLAMRSGAIRPALRAWPFVLAFGVIEMGIPWLLLGHAETRVASGFAGLMLVTVPIIGTVLSFLLGDRHALAGVRLLGLGAGVLGVGLLVGLDSLSGHVDALSVIELLLVALCYAVGPVIASRKLAHVPSMGVIALSLAIVAVLYLPVTATGLSGGLPSTSVIVSVLVLALVCTALAFVLFFELIAEAGPVRATVITFVNPAVAVLLGLVVLSEPLTWGMVLGFPLVLLGSYWATRATRSEETDVAPA
ncbi:MAG TPA: DMT family transporter [Candidatus Nanopelagicales bacterium]|nr:DMT family transporter [Candidatus Nanopelagicales bacterium]